MHKYKTDKSRETDLHKLIEGDISLAGGIKLVTNLVKILLLWVRPHGSHQRPEVLIKAMPRVSSKQRADIEQLTSRDNLGVDGALAGRQMIVGKA